MLIVEYEYVLNGWVLFECTIYSMSCIIRAVECLMLLKTIYISTGVDNHPHTLCPLKDSST